MPVEWLRTRSVVRHTLLELRYEKWFRNSVKASEGLNMEDHLAESSDATSDDEDDSGNDDEDDEDDSDPAAPPLCAAPSISLPPQPTAAAMIPRPAPTESSPPPPLPPPADDIEDFPACEAAGDPACEAAGENEAVAVVASDAPGSCITQDNLDALIELGDIYQASRPPAPEERLKHSTKTKHAASSVEQRWFHGKQFHEWKKGF